MISRNNEPNFRFPTSRNAQFPLKKNKTEADEEEKKEEEYNDRKNFKTVIILINNKSGTVERKSRHEERRAKAGVTQLYGELRAKGLKYFCHLSLPLGPLSVRDR